MNDIWAQLREYTLQLIVGIPLPVYEGTASVLCLGVVVLIACKGWKKGLQYAAVMTLICYISLLYCSTLFFRVTKDVREYNFYPFWSYEKPELLVENAMNVLVFIPVGMMLGLVSQKTQKAQKRLWRTRITRIALITGAGLIISISIEAMQYFFHRGFAETDDVMHNTLGCLIGYGLYASIRYGYERIGKRSVNFLVEI